MFVVGRSGASLLVAVVAVLALPGIASGATVAAAGSTVVYTAAAGENNRPLFSYVQGSPGQYTVTGDTAPLVAGAGCIVIVGGIQCEDTGITSIQAILDNLDDQGGSLAGSVPVRVVLNAGDGNDTFTGGIQNDQLTGGNGIDTLNGGDNADTITGDAGGDILSGDGGSDQIQGGLDGDNMTGGDGEDRLFGGFGNDVQSGGNGFDFLGQGGDDQGADSYSGGPGLDNVFFTNAAGPVTITPDDVTNDGPQGQDNVASDIENYTGGPFADTINGSDGPNVIEGLTGADLLNGGGGNDQVYGHSIIPSGDGNNTINGGDGNDILVDGGANEILNGGSGDDQINAGPGADEMIGGDGIDTVTWSDFTTYNQAFPVLNQLSVTLDDVPDDGYTSEGDNAHADNENIKGFAFFNFLRGNASPNVIQAAGESVIDLAGPGPDTAICGVGHETVIADPDDDVAPIGGGFCDTVSLTGPRSVFLAQFASNKAKKGAAQISVACLAGADSLCEGAIRVLKKGTTVGRETFELVPGESGVFNVELAESVRNSLNKGKKVSLEMRATGTDNSGLSELDVDSAKLKGKKK